MKPDKDTKRNERWPIKVNKYIIEAQKKMQETPDNFEYGTFDCCTFAAGMVQEATGWDPMEEFRGKYSTVEEYEALMEELHGTKILYKILIKKFGKPVHGSYARHGDIVWFDGNLGIMLGKYGLFLMDGGDFGYVRISHIEKAFKVGHD